MYNSAICKKSTSLVLIITIAIIIDEISVVNNAPLASGMRALKSNNLFRQPYRKQKPNRSDDFLIDDTDRCILAWF